MQTSPSKSSGGDIYLTPAGEQGFPNPSGNWNYLEGFLGHLGSPPLRTPAPGWAQPRLAAVQGAQRGGTLLSSIDSQRL